MQQLIFSIVVTIIVLGVFLVKPAGATLILAIVFVTGSITQIVLLETLKTASQNSIYVKKVTCSGPQSRRYAWVTVNLTTRKRLGQPVPGSGKRQLQIVLSRAGKESVFTSDFTELPHVNSATLPGEPPHALRKEIAGFMASASDSPATEIAPEVSAVLDWINFLAEVPDAAYPGESGCFQNCDYQKDFTFEQHAPRWSHLLYALSFWIVLMLLMLFWYRRSLAGH